MAPCPATQQHTCLCTTCIGTLEPTVDVTGCQKYEPQMWVYLKAHLQLKALSDLLMSGELDSEQRYTPCCVSVAMQISAGHLVSGLVLGIQTPPVVEHHISVCTTKLRHSLNDASTTGGSGLACMRQCSQGMSDLHPVHSPFVPSEARALVGLSVMVLLQHSESVKPAEQACCDYNSKTNNLLGVAEGTQQTCKQTTTSTGMHNPSAAQPSGSCYTA